MALSHTEKQVAYMAFVNRERNVRHHRYDEEMKQYELMKAGKSDAVTESTRMMTSGLNGHLSDDPVRNVKYLLVANITITTRFAIEGGMDSETAYNSSDLFINRMDLCNTVEEVMAVHHEMFTYFTEYMASLKKRSVYSKAVIQCILSYRKNCVNSDPSVTNCNYFGCGLWPALWSILTCISMSPFVCQTWHVTLTSIRVTSLPCLRERRVFPFRIILWNGELRPQRICCDILNTPPRRLGKSCPSVPKATLSAVSESTQEVRQVSTKGTTITLTWMPPPVQSRKAEKANQRNDQ